MSTVEERLASLEARMDAMADLRDRITEFRIETVRRFDSLDRKVDSNFTYLDQKIDSSFTSLDQKIDHTFASLDQKIDRSFASLDQKIDRHFTWLVGTQIALLLAVVGALVGAYYR